MSNTSTTKTSMAGTPGVEYTVMQARVRDGRLNIQGRGHSVNRLYGVAEEIKVPSILLLFFDNQDAPLQSLAGSGKGYVEIQVRSRGDELHVQAAGPKVNRDYGVSFNLVNTPAIDRFVREEEELRVQAQTEQAFVVEDEEEEEDFQAEVLA